jgi:molecular chaperone HscB
MSDHFQRLGLPRRFSVDAAELERAYLARSRVVHPDYHLAGSGADLGASLELSAAINEAYKTLRDPFTRAEYLLKLEGGPSASDQKQMPPAFLAEMLEARERIEETRAGCPDDASVLAAEFEKRYDGLLADVAGQFDRLQALPGGDASRVGLLAQIRGQLNSAKYVRGLLRDLNAE